MSFSMTEDRLNGLAVLNIHKEIPIDIDEVINRISRQKQRRMKTAKIGQNTNELINFSYFIILKYIITIIYIIHNIICIY